MISIQGLTPKQHALISVMWEIDSMDKVRAFIATLPAQDARDADTLLKLAIWETLELEGQLDAYKDQADRCIDSARS